MKNLVEISMNHVNNVWPLFTSFPHDNIIDAVIQGYHGKLYADDLTNSKLAMVVCKDIVYIAGEINEDYKEIILAHIPIGGELHVSEVWHDYLVRSGVKLKKFTRYAMDHQTINSHSLNTIIDHQPKDVEVVFIDEAIYHQLLEEPWGSSLVENFTDYKAFNKYALGYVVKKNHQIVSGTSSFAKFNGGLEIEVVTKRNHRQKGYAKLSAAYFIKTCLEKELIPHWDAANKVSVQLAKCLGYSFKRSYEVFEVVSK